MRTVLGSCQGLPEATFGPGEVLLAEGGRAGILYILAEGDVEVLTAVLETLVHQQDEECVPGSDRDPDPTI